MPYDPDDLVARYAAGAHDHPNGKPLAADATRAWGRVVGAGAGRLGAARVRDSARREWLVEARRDASRGRYLVLSPAHGDVEPFRASPDGYRPEVYLRISGAEWNVLALLAADRAGDAGRDDEELRDAAFRLVDRMVRDAQHRLLLGAADDEDDEDENA